MATLIGEIGEKWKEFDAINDDVSKNGLAEAIAGANQAAVFQSLMQNIDVMKQVQSELGNGEHFQSMANENAQYVDSIAGKLNELKETWVGVFNTLFNSEFAKGAIDVLINISEAISTVISTLDDLGMLTPVLTGLGVLLTSKAFSGIGSIFSVGSREARGFASILPTITSGFTSMNPPATRFGATLVGMGTNVALAGTKIGGMLSVASSFIPWAVAAGVAVAGASAAIDYFTESLDEEKERLNETVAARKEEISSLEEQKGKLQEIQKEYDTLANKPKKTSSEVERLKTLTQELAQIKPELVVGYDESGNPILSMTGDVQDLIDELDRATESKKRLLSVEQEDSAKNSIKQLHGRDPNNYTYEFGAIHKKTEFQKLENLTTEHVENMSKLEKDRDKIINKLYEATGEERRKLLKDLDKANYEIEKAQDEYTQAYKSQLDIIKEYSDGIGGSLFSNIEGGAAFKNASEELQNQFSSLRQHLDFSDIKTEDQLLEAEYALNKLFNAAKNGDVDLGKLKSQLEKANQEFAKTQDSEKYAKSIENIIEQIKEIPGLENINIDILKDMFEGIDTSVAKGKDALDEFLRAYGKTKADLEKDDGFAKALVEQKRQLEDALNNLEITGKPDVDIEIAYDMISDSNLPEQLRDLIRTMINSGVDGTEVLKVTQAVLLDIQDGKIDNPEKLQEMIDEAFGEKGRFEITPEILMTDDTKIAGIETVIKQITDRFGEIPPVVKTVIEAEGITAFNEAKKLTEMYLGIPEEVRTVMTNNGMETLTQIQLVDLMLKGLPEEIVTNILTNFPNVVTDAENIDQVISNLPASILMEIKNNYPEVVEKSKLLQEAIDNIPATKESTISVKEEIKKDPMSLLDRLFGKNKTDMTATAVIDNQINNLDGLKEFNGIWTGLWGKGSGGSSSGGGSSRTIDEYSVNPITDEVSKVTRAAKNTTSASGGSGFNATINVTVNGMEDIQRLQDLLNNFTINDINATISVHTSVAAQNLSGLIVRINQAKTSLNTLSAKNVDINTAQSAKNLSGLIVRVQQYNAAIDGATTKTVSVETAQAAKNISGLIAKIGEYNKTNPKALTFKTNATTITNQVKALASSVRNVPTSRTITFSMKQSGSIPRIATQRMVYPNPYETASHDIQAQTLTMQQMTRDAIAQPISVPVSYATPVVSQLTMSRALNPSHVIDMLDKNVDAFKGFEDTLKRIQNELDLIGKKAEFAFGDEKIAYLKKQITLLEEQQRIQNQISSDLAIQQNELKYYLSQKGFSFNSQGDVTNQVQKLYEMEKYVDTLEKKLKAQGDKKSDALQNQYDSARESLEKTKDVLNQYIENNSNEIVGATAEWYELQQQINDTRQEIIQAGIDAKNFKFEINASKFDAEVKSLANAISLIDKQMIYAFGEDKDRLLNNKIDLLKQQQNQLHNLANQYREQAKVIGQFLNSRGFIIETDGSIGNMEFLESFRDTGIYDEILKQIEAYNELTLSKIPECSVEWWNLQESIDESRIAILEAKDEMSDLVLDINISKLEKAMDKIKTEISRLDREIDKAFGGQKESLLGDKINALKEEQNKLHQMANEYRKQRQEIANFLNGYGFIIHPDGEIGNPEYILNFKQDPALMEYFKDLIDKHTQLGDKISGLSSDWWDVQGSIEDTQDAIEEARKELQKFLQEAKVDALLDQFNDLAHALDLIDKKLEHATGKDKLDLMSDKLELIKKQQVELQKHMEYFTNRRYSLQMELGSLGFKFDSDGDITNYVSQLENLANSSNDFEEVKDKLEEYFDIQNDRLPGIESDWQDLENAYKDVLKEQLETTKDIEDKITEIYKKQIKDRIDAMNKETDEKVKNLKKQQDAYNKYRDEVDYKNEYEDKLSEVNDIQRQLDIAMRDSSLQGQKKVKELQKLLADAQKELDKITQNKIDSDVNDAFEDEMDRITESNESAIEQLEKEWADSKIAEMVSQAISSGIFTGIDGQISGLQDAMLEFAQSTGELFGVMGTVIKSELITNLGIALDTFKDLDSILKGLDLDKYSTLSNNVRMDLSNYATPSTPIQTSNVEFNAPIINIEGNVDNGVMEDLKSLQDQLTKNIINTISSSMR